MINKKFKNFLREDIEPGQTNFKKMEVFSVFTEHDETKARRIYNIFKKNGFDGSEAILAGGIKKDGGVITFQRKVLYWGGTDWHKTKPAEKEWGKLISYDDFIEYVKSGVDERFKNWRD